MLPNTCMERSPFNLLNLGVHSIIVKNKLLQMFDPDHLRTVKKLKILSPILLRWDVPYQLYAEVSNTLGFYFNLKRCTLMN